MAEAVNVLQKEYPANSHRVKVEEDKKVEKVVTSGVVTKKPGFGKRFKESFFGEDVGSVGDYIVFDVLIPAVKDTIVNMVQNGIDMLVWGSVRGGDSRRVNSRSHFNYSTNSRVSYRNDDRNRPIYSRRSNSIDDIICEDRGEAEQVIDELMEQIDRYGKATVADLYDCVGITTSPSDNNWGWETLSSANVRRVSGGYLIDLPRPVSLR